MYSGTYDAYPNGVLRSTAVIWDKQVDVGDHGTKEERQTACQALNSSEPAAVGAAYITKLQVYFVDGRCDLHIGRSAVTYQRLRTRCVHL